MIDKVISNLIAVRYEAKNAHWNCKGLLFYEFHLLFDRIYNDYEEVIDRLAERYVGLGNKVPGTIPQIHALSDLEEDTNLNLTVEFAKDLLKDLGVVQSYITQCMEEHKADQVTLNILCDAGELVATHTYLLKSSLSTT